MRMVISGGCSGPSGVFCLKEGVFFGLKEGSYDLRAVLHCMRYFVPCRTCFILEKERIISEITAKATGRRPKTRPMEGATVQRP